MSQHSKCKGCSVCKGGVRGAGTLMVDQGKDHFILVKDQRRTYNDAGGILNKKHHDARHCAVEELKEETRGTVRNNLKNCSYIDLPAGKYHKYRLYILYVNGHGQPKVSCSKFYKIDPMTLPGPYQETTRMTRFPIAQFKRERAKKHGHGFITSSKKTDNGSIEPVNGRVLKGIAFAIDNGYL